MAINKNLHEEASFTGRVPKQLYGSALVGKTVSTTYGNGIVIDCRQEDSFVYVIQLLRNDVQSDASSPLAMLYTRELPTRMRTAEEATEELNIAYEAQEKMRRMNLEMHCFELGITEVDHNQCTACLLHSSQSTEPRNRFPRLQRFVDSARETAEHAHTSAAAVAAKASANNSNNFPRLRKLWGKTASKNDATCNTETKKEDEKTDGDEEQKPAAVEESQRDQRIILPRIQKMLDDRQKTSSSPCLICGNPVCSKHGSSNFKKEGITLCIGCERLFELDFIIECVSTPDPSERAKRIDHMIDCYDRCLLLLKYSTQYVEQIALSLEQQRHHQNRIGLGSSSVGVLSGVLGIAAAATILTPAGGPLLIASLFFGGSATAVQTGTEAYNFFSQPNKLADRIIALHGMILSLLRVTSTLRDAMMRDHIRTDVFEAEKASLANALQDTVAKNKAGVLAASNVGRAAALSGVAGTEAGVVASATTIVSAEAAAGAGARGATALSRAGTAAARTVRFARFAGGALSAAVLVMEANAIHSTLKEIHSGSPCVKAQRIRAIASEVRTEDLPTTSELDEECQAYLTALANRPLPPPEVTAVEAAGNAAIEDFPEAECSTAPIAICDDLGQNGDDQTGALIVAGQEAPVAAFATPAATAPVEPSNNRSHQFLFFGNARSSLFQSINFQRPIGSNRAEPSQRSR